MQSHSKEAVDESSVLRTQLKSNENQLESLTSNLSELATRWQDTDAALRVAEHLIKVKDIELSERDDEIKQTLLAHQREIQRLVSKLTRC